MYASEIVKKTTSVQELMSRFDERLQKKEAEYTPSDQYEDFLPCFSVMHQISTCQSEEWMLKVSQITSTIHHLQKTAGKLDGVSYLSESIARSLRITVDSSRMVVHLLNHVTRIGTVPLPREHHEHFLQIIKNCLQVANDKANWSANALMVNWPVILSSLKSSFNKYKHLTEFLDSSIQEHHLLQLRTLKMLEQTSKFCFH